MESCKFCHYDTGLCVYRLIMSDEKVLFEGEKEEVELLKNEPSSMEEEEMAEEKPAVERSDRGELTSVT